MLLFFSSISSSGMSVPFNSFLPTQNCFFKLFFESPQNRYKHTHFHNCHINGNPLQYSYLENPRDGGVWWAAVYEVAQSRTWLKRLSSSSSSRPLLIIKIILARCYFHLPFFPIFFCCCNCHVFISFCDCLLIAFVLVLFTALCTSRASVPLWSVTGGIQHSLKYSDSQETLLGLSINIISSPEWTTHPKSTVLIWWWLLFSCSVMSPSLQPHKL